MSIDVYGSRNFLPDDIRNLKAAALYYAVGDHCHAKAYGSLLWHRAGLDVSVSAPLNIFRFSFCSEYCCSLHKMWKLQQGRYCE